MGSASNGIELFWNGATLGTFTGNMSEAGKAFREKRDPDWSDYPWHF